MSPGPAAGVGRVQCTMLSYCIFSVVIVDFYPQLQITGVLQPQITGINIIQIAVWLIFPELLIPLGNTDFKGVKPHCVQQKD